MAIRISSKKRRQPDKKIMERLRKKKIYFGCAICGKPIKNNKIIDVILRNPRKKVEPKWQQTWACENCTRKTFKSLGRDLVILSKK
jgi:hypothetical protein